jgi:hypothetical protein
LKILSTDFSLNYAVFCKFLWFSPDNPHKDPENGRLSAFLTVSPPYPRKIVTGYASDTDGAPA